MALIFYKMLNKQHELPMVVQNDNVLVDARLLHRQLKVGKDFSTWIRARIKEFGFEEGKDFSPNLGSKIGTHGGANKVDYLLSMDMAKELAMLERNEVGREIRRYFIAKEKELRGISQLPKSHELFRGIKATNINGRKMYPYREVRAKCGYSVKGSSANHKNRYPQHFVLQGHILLTTEEFCLHLHHSKQVTNNRATLQAMQPVLPFNFGEPLKIKGGNHA
jgi:phage anti-repressor protein